MVIGHSLGGIYARTLGRRLPQCVEQVILLASPIKDPHKNSNPYIKILALLTRQIRDAGHKCGDQMATICGVHGPDAPLVPETLIYSRRDGVIDWTSCIEDGPQVSAFEVDSTHLGLPYNLDTLRIVRARVEKTRLQPSTPSATSPRPGL